MNPQCDEVDCTADATKAIVVDDKPYNVCNDHYQDLLDEMEDEQ